jgi:hypothetical protein
MWKFRASFQYRRVTAHPTDLSFTSSDGHWSARKSAPAKTAIKQSTLMRRDFNARAMVFKIPRRS